MISTANARYKVFNIEMGIEDFTHGLPFIPFYFPFIPTAFYERYGTLLGLILHGTEHSE